MNYGSLDRRVQFRRATLFDDGYQVTDTWADHGSLIWAGRKDVNDAVNDAERAAAGWVEATVASRFVVRSTPFTRGLTAKDRLVCEGLTFDIQGIKQIGRMDRLEITAVARADT